MKERILELSVPQAAHYLNVRKGRVNQLIKQGKLGCRILGKSDAEELGMNLDEMDNRQVLVVCATKRVLDSWKDKRTWKT